MVENATALDAEAFKRTFPRLWFWSEFLKRRYAGKGGQEIKLLRGLLRHGGVAVDVGASFGFYATEMARYASSVLAFEPNPMVAEFARCFVPRNVTVVNVALSDHVGYANLRIPINGKGRPTTELATLAASNILIARSCMTQSVPTRRLDDFGLECCGLIKIDVEGYEEQVIDGAFGVIVRDRPNLLVEFSEGYNPGGLARVVARLEPLGYRSKRVGTGDFVFRADQ